MDVLIIPYLSKHNQTKPMNIMTEIPQYALHYFLTRTGTITLASTMEALEKSFPDGLPREGTMGKVYSTEPVTYEMGEQFADQFPDSECQAVRNFL